MLRIYDCAIQLVRDLRAPLGHIARHDPDLARQFRRALASVPLNIAEGSGSRGRNRDARYENAIGSLREVRAVLDVAEALGYVDPIPADVANTIQRIIATLLNNIVR